MLRRVTERVATVHIHRGADRLFPSGNAQFFEPQGSRHARRRRKRAATHVRWLETQHLRCHSSFYRTPLFSIMPESRTARKHPSCSGIPVSPQLNYLRLRVSCLPLATTWVPPIAVASKWAFHRLTALSQHCRSVWAKSPERTAERMSLPVIGTMRICSRLPRSISLVTVSLN